MTPYRVLTVNNRTGTEAVLVSMLSKNPNTGERRIFIVDKWIPELFVNSYEDKRRIAHKTVCASDCVFEAKYTMKRNDAETRYIVYASTGRKLPLDYYIQSDCLIGAMRDYIELSDYRIIDVL